jgi:hypothetical protein
MACRRRWCAPPPGSAGCGAMPARLAAVLRSRVPSSGMSAMTTPAMRLAMPGIETRISRLRVSDRGLKPAVADPAQEAYTCAITGRQLAAISASNACAGGLLHDDELRERRRVESAFTRALAVRSGAKAVGHGASKAGDEPGVRRSVLATRPRRSGRRGRGTGRRGNLQASLLYHALIRSENRNTTKRLRDITVNHAKRRAPA